MLATAVNALAIVFGGALGVFFKRLIREDLRAAVLKAVGVVVLLLGIIGTVNSAFYLVRYDLLLIISIALGTLIGVAARLDVQLKRFGAYLERKINKGAFSEGFITALLVFCIGAMAIVGSINAALGDPSIIYLKAAIDGITALALASSLGAGVMLAAVPVLLYQGALTGLGLAFGNFMPAGLIDAFGLVGYAIVAVIGLDFILPEKIKAENMLPALLLVIILYLVGLR
ncbi:MAG TPA: DUF554 domain-containing protein [Bacilli bacterium]|jgi:uncharacterized membrane protein YqgA involved in biofilm formation|nr:DUF554 domain-containing protein [Bacilli bacterium]HPZ28022.1 DUF554 domain-containing protein [Bacilli bacterium]HQC90158.1 DUF554 domain-containing protein [Bacilli bacterium]